MLSLAMFGAIAGHAFAQDLPAPGAPPLATPDQATAPAPSDGGGDSMLGAGDSYVTDEDYIGGPRFMPFGRNMWLDSEYLLWSIQGSNLPSMATTSPATTPIAQAGVPGLPTTTEIFGGRDTDTFSGGRWTFTFANNLQKYDALEFTSFVMGGSQNNFNASTPPTAVLARPFYNLGTGLPDSQVIGYPGARGGDFSVNTDTLVWGAELNVKPNYADWGYGRIDWIAGLRYFQFQESLTTREQIRIGTAPSAFVPGTAITLDERFDSENYFAGLQLGIGGEIRRGIFTLSTFTKVALGAMYQNFGVQGTTSVAVPTQPVLVQPGALLANETNIGRDNKTLDFGVLPEFNLRLGAQLTARLKVHVGYTFLYVNPLVRPADLMSNFLNPSILPPSDPSGLRRSARNFGTSEAWLQGLTTGFEFLF